MASVITAGTASNTALNLTGDTSGELQLKTNNGSTTALTLTTGGNINIPTTAARITGDFSTGTIANRVMFQTSTTNGNTNLQAIPNGTGNTTALQVFNSSDAANAGRAIFSINSTEAQIQSTVTGTGTNLPLTIYTGGSERLRIDTSGRLLIGVASGSGRITLTQTGSTSTVIGNGNTVPDGADPWLATGNNNTWSSATFGWSLYDSNVDGGLLLYRRAGSTTGSLVTRFDRTFGTVQFANTISVGGATPTTSGAGITFPATQSASSDANTLDDYEEGTWTPNVRNASQTSTFTVIIGRYIKVGRQVTCWCSVDGGSSGAATGNFTISGLPFTYENSPNWINFGQWNGSGTVPNGAIISLGSVSEVYAWSGGGYVTEIKTFFTCSFTYRATA